MHLRRARWQNSIGFAHQIGTTMAFEADYVYTQGRNEKDIIDNVNLTYNPATGANYPFSDVSRRAFPRLGQHLAARPHRQVGVSRRCRPASPSG